MVVTKPTSRPELLEGIVWASAALGGRRPRLGPLHAGAGAGRFGHTEWSALLGRFVIGGEVDYPNLLRVRRLVQTYLSRLAEVDPEHFIDTDDQLAFYLNAYNTIAVDQVLRAYPVRSIRDVPAAFLRPYPLGRRNLSLHTLHANVLRSFGDPRVHIALAPAARGGPALAATAFTGPALQTQLDVALRAFLADDVRGLRYDAATDTLWLSPLLAWFGGDFVRPAAMPGTAQLLQGRRDLAGILAALRPALPAPLARVLDARPRLRVLPFDWRLNSVVDPPAPETAA